MACKDGPGGLGKATCRYGTNEPSRRKAKNQCRRDIRGQTEDRGTLNQEKDPYWRQGELSAVPIKARRNAVTWPDQANQSTGERRPQNGVYDSRDSNKVPVLRPRLFPLRSKKGVKGD